MTKTINPNSSVIIGLTGYQSGELAARLSVNGTKNLWYSPLPSNDQIVQLANPTKLNKLESNPEELARYLNSIRDSITYPAIWDHISINAPIHEALKARIGTYGEFARNRILYQILIAMQDLFTPVPGSIDFDAFIELVHKINTVPMNSDGDITPVQIELIRNLINELNPTNNYLIKRTVRRLQEKTSLYLNILESQEEELTEDIQDKIARTPFFVVTEITTQPEADFINSQMNGILVCVNQKPTDIDANSIDGYLTNKDALKLYRLGRLFAEGKEIETIFEKELDAKD